jgi:hypothetical protein
VNRLPVPDKQALPLHQRDKVLVQVDGPCCDHTSREQKPPLVHPTVEVMELIKLHLRLGKHGSFEGCELARAYARCAL